ncbi:MAG: SMI1/KNR4 family protein [Verrucomicrobiales bacterium]|nr:SMI1/KNR4 family protein [Verrucomicrobiales bacterium]
MNTKSPKTCCVEMVGPDVQMDQHGSSYDPANRLPAKCQHCSFPYLDFVPQPYLLTKGVVSPSEMSPAQMGNFLVRKRARQIFEIVVPQACAFYPTIEKKTKKPTDWSLAVPKAILAMPGRKADKQPSCPKCHEPKSGYAFEDHARYIAQLRQFDSQRVDVFKSQDWDSSGTAEDDFVSVNRERKKSGMPPQSWKEHIQWAIPGLEPPTHPQRWTRRHLSRNLFFSIRLEQLLKRAKVKGQLVRSYAFKEVQPSSEDEKWIEEKLRLLADKGLTGAVKPTQKAGGIQSWFQQFLKRNATTGQKSVRFAAVEQKQSITLPQAYKDFISAVGSKSFADVCGMEGSTTTVLLPHRLDFKNYRRGMMPYLEGEQAEVDGVMFAEIDSGDCFVFDVSAKASDCSIYWYRHEENDLEPFAANFAECIKRFVQKN